MEWMLQVVDEFDDCIGALRLQVLGLQADLGVVAGGGATLAAVLTATWLGADALVLSTALGMLGLAALLKMRKALLQDL